MRLDPIKSQTAVGAVLVVLLCLLSVNSAHAQLLNFNFSFVSDPKYSNVDGSVAGEIIGLQNDANSVPSDIILTSVPPGLGITTFLPYSLKDHGWKLSEIAGDNIAVSNGVITSAFEYEANLNNVDFLDLNADIKDNGVDLGVLNGLSFQSQSDGNFSGFSGTTYTPAAVPEPVSWTLGIFGLLAFWYLCARSSRTTFKSK